MDPLSFTNPLMFNTQKNQMDEGPDWNNPDSVYDYLPGRHQPFIRATVDTLYQIYLAQGKSVIEAFKLTLEDFIYSNQFSVKDS